MKEPTKIQLQQALKKAGVPFKSKTIKAELKKLLANSSKPNNKKPLGAKAVLRERFTRSGVVTPKQIDQIADRLSVTRSTVLTAMTDLKNRKYAGAAGPLHIQKDDDGTYRLAK